MRRVLIHIDRLVLKDFRPEDRHAIAAGLQQELGRVFAGRDAVSLLRALGDVPRLPVDGVHLGHGAIPQLIGATVAQGIGRAIKK